MPQPRHVLRRTTLRRRRGTPPATGTFQATWTAAGTSTTSWLGAGPAGVVSVSDFTFLGGFKLPVNATLYPAAGTGGQGRNMETGVLTTGLAVRRVGGNPHLFFTTSDNSLYEITAIPTLSTGAVSTWPAPATPSTSWITAWGDIYASRQTQQRTVRSVPTSTSVELQECNAENDDFCQGWFIDITSGTGSGQTRTITSYNASTRTATINAAWTTTPDTSSVYVLYQGSVVSYSQGTPPTNLTITLDSNASATDNAYRGMWILIVSGPAAGLTGQVVSYNGTTKTAQLLSFAFGSDPNTGLGGTAPTSSSKWVIVKTTIASYKGEGGTSGDGWWLGSGGVHTHGLHWDETDGRLYYGFGHEYNNSTQDPCIAYVKLDDTTTTVKPFGPWRLGSFSSKMGRGVTALAPDLQSLVGGRRLAGAMGGYYSQFGAEGSYGPTLVPITTPGTDVNAPSSVAYGDQSASAFPAASTGTALMEYNGIGTQPSAPYPGQRPDNYTNRDRSDAPWTATIETIANTTRTGTAQGGAASSITLAASTTETDSSDFKGARVLLTGGTGAGQERRAWTWNSSTKALEVLPNWTTVPDATTTYSVQFSTIIMTGASEAIWKESVEAAGWGMLDHTVRMTSGAANGSTLDIGYNNYTPRLIRTYGAWATTPGAGETFEVYGGTAAAGSSTTIQFKTNTFGSSATYVDSGNWMYVAITAGTGNGQDERRITAYDSSTKTATVSPSWGTAPDPTSQYLVYRTGMSVEVWDPSGGVGYWTWQDTVDGLCYIAGSTKQGYLATCLLGTGDCFYEASGIHSYPTGKQVYWLFYNVEDHVAVANGTKQPYEVVPSSMSADPQFGGAQSNDTGHHPNCCFDPVAKRLYVVIPYVWLDGPALKPACFVYQLNN